MQRLIAGLLLFLAAIAQQSTSEPVASALLEIKRAHLFGTTALDGSFSINFGGVVNLTGKVVDQTIESVIRGPLQPRLVPDGAMKAFVPADVHTARIDAIDLQGRILSTRLYTNHNQGEVILAVDNIANRHASQLCIIRMTLGTEHYSFPVMHLKEWNARWAYPKAVVFMPSVDASGSPSSSLRKAIATSPGDTLIIHKAFYLDDSVFIPTYNGNLGTITITRLFADTALCTRISPDSLLNIGVKYYNDNNYKFAVLYFDQYLKRYPSLADGNDVRFYYARSLFKEKAYDSAIAQANAFLMSRKASTNRAFAQLTIGNCYYAKASIDTPLYQQALTAYNAVLTNYPTAVTECSHALEHIGECYYNFAADYAQAENTMLQVLSRYPSGTDVPDAQYYIGRCRQRAQDYSGALFRFNIVLAQYPTSSLCDNCVYWIGRCYFSQANWSDAVARFVVLRSSYPTSIYIDNSYYYGCLAYIQLGNCTQAKADFSKMQTWYPASVVLGKTQAAVSASCP
jgi:TolA-binding protein